uniref:FMRFamide-related neuropeptides n=1 Tax=Panagrellus redivivus TaxID=6233 RepID=A0A7E4VUR2_PANRE
MLARIVFLLTVLPATLAFMMTYGDLCRMDSTLCQKPVSSYAASPVSAEREALFFRDALPRPSLSEKPTKRGYDFIRFGRSADRQTKKAASTYDYIRFGRR